MRTVFFANNELHFEGQEVALNSKVQLRGAIAGSFGQEIIKFDNQNYTVVGTFPSINTNVCDAQVSQLGEISKKHPDFNFITFSMDLPSALDSYVCTHSASSLKMYSDYRDRFVAKEFGVLINELQLFGRALFILDKDNKVVYKQINSQLTDQVDFEALKKELKKLSQ